MNPKQKRTIDRDVSTLFSDRALRARPTMEEWTENPTVRTDQGNRPVSTVGLAALRRLTSLISDIPEVRDVCSPKEIAEDMFERYSGWVLRSGKLNGQEFPISFGVLRILDAMDSQLARSFFLRNGFTPTARQRAVNWAQLLSSQSHGAGRDRGE